MLLALLNPALADSTLHLSTSAAVGVTVDGSAYGLKPKKELDVKVDAGVRRLEAPGYAADLEIPDASEVWLSWDGSQLVLERAETRAAVRANKAMKVGSAAMAAGAAAQQAQATGDDLRAAKSDMDKAQSGELKESSHTEVNVAIGPDGMSSSSSRTTAGAGGVQHDERATAIGAGGVSQSSGSATLDGSGYSETSSSRSVSMVELDGGVAVRLTRVDADAPVAEIVSETPSTDEAPVAQEVSTEANEEPKAKPLKPEFEIWYAEASTQASGLTLRAVDAFLHATAGKLALHVQNTTDGYLAIRPYLAQATVGDAVVVGNGGKVKPPSIVDPGDKGRATVSLTGSGLQQDSWSLGLDGVVEAIPASGDAIDPGDFDLVSVNGFEVDGLACSLGGLKKKTKETSGRLTCEYGGDGYVLVDASQLAVVMGDQEWANGARDKGAQVLAPGDSVKLAFKWQVEARVEDMQFATMPFAWRGTFQHVEGTPVAFPALELTRDEEKTAESN